MGRLVWAQLLHDIGAGDEASRELFEGHDLLAASAALRALTAGRRRLIVIDDIDTGGHDAVEVLALVASRVIVSSTAVLATAETPLGVGRDLKLAGLAESELGEVIGDIPAGQRRAVWVASGGMPGTARMLAGQLDGLPPGRDALVHLALHATKRGEFLTVDDSLIRLLEQAIGRTGEDAIRARLLARMSRELLGDPLAGARRRSLADEAQWRPRPKAGSLTPADPDWIIDAHFEAERRGDVDAILATVSDDISHEVLGAGLGKRPTNRISPRSSCTGDSVLFVPRHP